MDILSFALFMLAITGTGIFVLYRCIRVRDAEWRELTDDAESEK